MKLATIISGVILTLTGIYCIARSGTTFLAVAFILGLAMLIHGIMSLVSCLTERRQGFASGYVLADGAVSIILSAVVLLNQLNAEATIPLFFGMWLLYSGALHTMQALVVKGFGERYWRLGLIFGLLTALVGISGFVHPIVSNTAVVLLLGVYFTVQGISVTVLGLHFKKKRRTAEKEQ